MPATKLPALMFAAGFGTRMKDLTKDRPKPLIEVAGKPLIDHALALVQGAECAPIVANLHYRADVLEAHLRPKGVVTIDEQPDILETGGGLRNALPLLGSSPVVTVNSDALWAGPNPIELLKQAWRPEEMDTLLVCVPLAHTVGHQGAGDFDMSENNALERGSDVVFGGIQMIKTDLLSQISEPAFSLNVVWDMMLSQGRLFGLTYPGRWCDVGHPAGIKQAEDMLDVPHV